MASNHVQYNMATQVSEVACCVGACSRSQLDLIDPNAWEIEVELVQSVQRHSSLALK